MTKGAYIQKDSKVGVGGACSFQRHFAVFAAALLMSTIAVGAAVGPGAGSGAASARSFITVTYA